MIFAVLVYGVRRLLSEYMAERFTHRAQVSAAEAMMDAKTSSHTSSTLENIGRDIRGARRCVLNDVPSFLDNVMETVVYAGISISQSTSIGLALLLVLVLLLVLHVADDVLHTTSMQKIYSGVAQCSNSGKDDDDSDPMSVVHQVAAATHRMSVFRTVVGTFSCLVEFASPVLFLYCCVDDIKQAKLNNGGVHEFQLFLAFITAMASVGTLHFAHAAARRSLSHLLSIRAIINLNLGRDVQKGWKSSKLKGGCTSANGVILLVVVAMMGAVAVLSMTGVRVVTFGCDDMQIECSLGAQRQISLIPVSQVFYVATGCKLSLSGQELLDQCLLVTSVGTGMGSTQGSNASLLLDETTTNGKGGSSSSSIEYGNFTQSEIKLASEGKTKSKGGLNVNGLREFLTLNSLDTSGLRNELEERMKLLLKDEAARSAAESSTSSSSTSSGEEQMYVLDDENDDVDPSIRSLGQLLVDGPSLTVSLEARYRNWIGEMETLRAEVTWEEIAEAAEIVSKLGDEDKEADEEGEKEADASRRRRRRRRSLASAATNRLNTATKDITFTKKVLGTSSSSDKEYMVTITVGDGYSDGSRNTLTAQLTGESGTSTKYNVLGHNWKRGETRSVLLKGMREVGFVNELTLVTNGKDAINLERITVEHVQRTIVSTALETTSAAVTAPAPAATESTTTPPLSPPPLAIDSTVMVLTGKYVNCQGTVKKFSDSTGKPHVCRDCTKNTGGKNMDGGCCSGSSCGYYATNQVEVLRITNDDGGDTEDEAAVVASSSLSVGSLVTVTKGKYAGCGGSIVLFSAATSKAKVCRECDGETTGGNSCCGNTMRTTCSYYKELDLMVVDADADAGAGTATENEEGTEMNTKMIEHSSYFSMATSLKCTGSKRKGTWSCSTTIKASHPIEDTIAGGGGGGEGAVGNCPKEGEAGWQGQPRMITSTLVRPKTVEGPFEYSFGKLWVDKNARGVSRFEYTARQDCGRLDRHGSFRIDHKRSELQATTGRAYPKYCDAPKRDGKAWSLDGLSSSQIKDQCVSVLAYDRGHLIPANHFDDNKETIKETNYMINILPQSDKMNRGAWLDTEMIVECLRDVEVVQVMGGAVYPLKSQRGKGTTPAEFFTRSHGIITPTHYWKIIVGKEDGLHKKDHGLMAFWMPNTVEATAKRTSEYVVSIRELERLLAKHSAKSSQGWPAGSMPEIFDLPSDVKDHVPEFWGNIEGCDRA